VLCGVRVIVAGLLIVFHICCGILIIFPSILCLGLFSLFSQTLRLMWCIRVITFVRSSHCNMCLHCYYIAERLSCQGISGHCKDSSQLLTKKSRYVTLLDNTNQRHNKAKKITHSNVYLTLLNIHCFPQVCVLSVENVWIIC